MFGYANISRGRLRPINTKKHTLSLYGFSFRAFSLMEMLLVVTLIGIMASIALPYKHLTNTRDKEHQLQRGLIEIRLALDKFNSDWRSGRISPLELGVSSNGYPKDLQLLVDGVASNQAGLTYTYLRRLPTNPFALSSVTLGDQWLYRSYAQPPIIGQAWEHIWDGTDIYDIIANTDKQNLKGDYYANW